MKRRGVLGALSAAGIASLTGCLGSIRQSNQVDSIQITDIRLYNWMETAIEIDVAITEDLDVTSWETYRVEASSERIISNTPSSPGEYSVLANPPVGTPRKTTASWVLDTYGQDLVEPPRVALDFDLLVDGTFSGDAEIME